MIRFLVAWTNILLEIFCLLGEDDVTAEPENMPQQLLQKKDEVVPSEEDGLAVVIPDHLQVHIADCQHLSFGSFGAGIGANPSRSMSSRTLKINLADAPSAADTTSFSQADARSVTVKLCLCFSSCTVAFRHFFPVIEPVPGATECQNPNVSTA